MNNSYSQLPGANSQRGLARSLSIIALFFLCAGAAYGQTALRGKVISEQSQAVGGATIIVSGAAGTRADTTLTDSQGLFQLSTRLAAPYKIRAQHWVM